MRGPQNGQIEQWSDRTSPWAADTFLQKCRTLAIITIIEFICILPKVFVYIFSFDFICQTVGVGEK